MNQSNVIQQIFERKDDVRIVTHPGGAFFTPQFIRSIGMIVCSDCGEIASDSKENCPSCKQPLIYIPEKDTPHVENTSLDGDLFKPGTHVFYRGSKRLIERVYPYKVTGNYYKLSGIKDRVHETALLIEMKLKLNEDIE